MEIIARLASLQHLHTTMVCKILPPPPFPHPPRTFAPTDCGSIPAPVGWENYAYHNKYNNAGGTKILKLTQYGFTPASEVSGT